MKTKRIEWEWSSHLSIPSCELQTYMQTLAMGIILAHQSGNMSPVDDNRTEEKIAEYPFNPLGELVDQEDLSRKIVKDCIFYRLFEDKMVHMQISHCWSSFNSTDTEGRAAVTDLGAYYRVSIVEIDRIAYSVIEVKPE